MNVLKKLLKNQTLGKGCETKLTFNMSDPETYIATFMTYIIASWASL